MKVRVAYSMELEEVPEQISKIFREQCEHLCDATKLLNISIDLLGDESHDMSLAAVEKTRQKLADVDQALSEMTGLLEGYIGAKKRLSSMAQENEPTTVPPPDTQYSAPTNNPQEEGYSGES